MLVAIAFKLEAPDSTLSFHPCVLLLLRLFGFVGACFYFLSSNVRCFVILCVCLFLQVLQQQFNAFVFEAEQAEYAAEQILWSFVEFPDNKMCIEMIEVTKPAGILSLLDEQTMFPNATDATFCAKLHAQIAPAHKKHFGTSPELKVSQCFVVHHYAGSIR